MSDKDYIASLIQEASNVGQLQNFEAQAARKLLDFDGEIYPADGCANTLSVLLQNVGIAVPDIYTALELGETLKNDRNWQQIPVGKQQPGDIGSTCGLVPHHGFDHVYLVLRILNTDEMVIADNQASHPHFRYASGQGGKTPTKFFLRAT
jgi:hypothetical protein